MTQQQHPITPPPELVQQWRNEEPYEGLLSRAAQWGADQELEACCEYVYERLRVTAFPLLHELRAARRPKHPSLKEQALALLQPGEPRLFNSEMQDTIRRALEQLPDS